MAKEQTEVLYVRIPRSIMEEVRKRADREERTLSAVATRMLRHAMLCEHKITVTEEL